MSEIEQLKDRIRRAAFEGLETSLIRDDYAPAGQMMINNLVDSGEFVSRRDRGLAGLNSGPWKVWSAEFAPRT